MLGGAATYISLAASFFTPVKLVGVVGDDFAQADVDLLARHGIDLEGLERVPGKVGGAWLFKDTRVPVSALLENLQDGATVNDFLEWFPGVSREQVEAVLKYEFLTGIRKGLSQIGHGETVSHEQVKQNLISWLANQPPHKQV